MKMNAKTTAGLLAAAALLGGVLAAAVPASGAAKPPALTTQTVTASGQFTGSGVPVTATCPAGTVVTGGGYDFQPPAAGETVSSSERSGNGWTATVAGGPFGVVLNVTAVCGSVTAAR
jgi:hypothetical protein